MMAECEQQCMDVNEGGASDEAGGTISGGEGKEKQSTTLFNINRKIFVGNISYRIKSRKLTQFFSKFGPVEYCYIVKDHLKKWSKGIAFITFESEECMQRALAASDAELYLDSRQMRVKAAELSVRTTYWQEPDRTREEEEEDIEDRLHEAAGDTADDSTYAVPTTTDGATADGATADDATTTINTLFDEILIRIFSLLTMKERIGVERVCWRWKHVVQRSWSNQTHVHFRNIFKRFGGLTDKMLNSVLVRCGRYLKCLDLSASPRCLTDFAMDIIGKYCPDLLELDLASVRMTDKSLDNLVTRCNKLQSVCLKKCLHISDRGVSNLLKGCPDLRCLDMTDLNQLPGKYFHNIGDRVRKLVLMDCYKLEDSCVETMATRCPMLEELYVSNTQVLTGAAIKTVCQKCTRLRIFHAVSLNTSVGAETIERIGNLSNLEDLNLSMNMVLNDSCLLAITRGCKKLRYLNISRCISITDTGIATLEDLPELRSLDISYLSEISDTSIQFVISNGKLRKLVAKMCNCITDDVILSLATLCPHIEHLDVSGCFCVTNRIFDGFKTTVAMETGKTIELYLGGTSVDWVSDDVDWMHGLAHLKVYMHSFVIDDLRSDRQMIVFGGDYLHDDLSEDEDHYPPQPDISDYHAGPIEYNDDWHEDGDDFDDFLDNDDPQAAERWDMS